MASKSRTIRRQPELSERDLRVLCDLVRFGPLRVEQLAERHGFPSQRAARDRLASLVRGDLLARYLLHTYLATSKGTRCTGLDLRPPGMPGPHLPHDLAVADLAFWLLDAEPGSDWVTERELRHGCGMPLLARRGGRRSSGTQHVPDGKLVSPDGQAAAIELELNIKSPADYDSICRWFGGALAFDTYRWFVLGPELERQLKEAADRHDLTHLMTVEQVPSAVRVLRWTG